MPHSTSTDNSVLLDKRVFFDSGALFGVKVRRYYHASRRSSEIDRKKQRYLYPPIWPLPPPARTPASPARPLVQFVPL